MPELISREFAMVTNGHQGRVLVLTASGHGDSSDMAALLALRRAMRAHQHERAYVLALDRVRLAADGVLGAGVQALCRGPECRPIAVVVRQAEAGLWRKHAMALARTGVLVGVFTCQQTALQWARARVLALFPTLHPPRQIAEPAPPAHKPAGVVHRLR